jgi:hypothetical protein
MTTTTDRFSVQVDSIDGGNHEQFFSTKTAAVRFAKEEVLWESTLYVSVTDEESGTTILNQKGSFA